MARYARAIMLAGVYLLTLVDCYKVLVVFPLYGQSHGILGAGYVRELLKKGHEVTYVTPFPLKEQPNLKQVELKYDMQVMEAAMRDSMNLTRMIEGEDMFHQDTVGMVHLMLSFNEFMLSESNLQAFLRDPNQQFDVVVVEWLFGDIYAGYAAVYQCPLVWSSSLDYHSLVGRLVDELSNPAYSADLLSHNVPPFTFVHRIQELWTLVRRMYDTKFNLLPEQEKAYFEAFGPAASSRGATLPPFEDVLYNGSLVLLNGHASLGGAPKLPQNAKEIGGYHIELDTKPLPADLQNIMDSSKNGVIYFSLGSNVKGKDLPQKLKNDILKLFGSFKQTVIWKLEEDILDLPKNVLVRSWCPQASILAHPNIKLFITHGGLLSTTETIHYGVPIIGVPVFGDQFTNMARAVAKGFALKVKLSMNLAADLGAAIEEVLGNDSYVKKVKDLSALYHDRPIQPGDELVYWIEHVVRSGGARHLRSAALLVPLYQKLYLDLLGLVLSGLVVLWVLGKKLLKRGKVQDLKKKRS